jgi:hypothetical protein
VTGGWRKLHNEELHGLYSSPSIVRVIKARRMRWAGHVARMGEVRGAYNILVGRPEGRRPLGRPRRRWEDNIMMNPKSVQANSEIVPLIPPRILPSTSFPIHYSLIIIVLDIILSELLTASLNEPKIK